MTQTEIEQLILENGFKTRSKEGYTTYEFGATDIYRVSRLLSIKMNGVSRSTQLKDGVTPTFQTWLRINCEPTRNTKMFKKGNRLMLNTELLELYKKEYNL